jgi:hypothetical protein
VRIGRKRWWVAGLVGGWAVALLVAAIWSVHHDPATVREQSDLAEGRRALDRAVAEVVDTAGPAVTAEVGPLRTSPGCQVTLARSGTELDQTVRLNVPAGQDPAALLDRLVEELPAAWGASYRPGANRFFADAGDFVAVRGGVAEDGSRVELTAETGCRPG